MENEIKNDKPNLLVDNIKGATSKHISNKMFSFIDNKNNFVAKLFKYNKKLMQTDKFSV